MLLLCFQSVAKFGGIDIFVSNAAVNPAMGGVLDVSYPFSLLYIEPLT